MFLKEVTWLTSVLIIVRFTECKQGTFSKALGTGINAALNEYSKLRSSSRALNTPRYTVEDLRRMMNEGEELWPANHHSEQQEPDGSFSRSIQERIQELRKKISHLEKLDQQYRAQQTSGQIQTSNPNTGVHQQERLGILQKSPSLQQMPHYLNHKFGQTTDNTDHSKRIRLPYSSEQVFRQDPPLPRASYDSPRLTASGLPRNDKTFSTYISETPGGSAVEGAGASRLLEGGSALQSASRRGALGKSARNYGPHFRGQSTNRFRNTPSDGANVHGDSFNTGFREASSEKVNNRGDDGYSSGRTDYGSYLTAGDSNYRSLKSPSASSDSMSAPVFTGGNHGEVATNSHAYNQHSNGRPDKSLHNSANKNTTPKRPAVVSSKINAPSRTNANSRSSPVFSGNPRYRYSQDPSRRVPAPYRTQNAPLRRSPVPSRRRPSSWHPASRRLGATN